MAFGNRTLKFDALAIANPTADLSIAQQEVSASNLNIDPAVVKTGTLEIISSNNLGNDNIELFEPINTGDIVVGEPSDTESPLDESPTDDSGEVEEPLADSQTETETETEQTEPENQPEKDAKTNISGGTTEIGFPAWFENSLKKGGMIAGLGVLGFIGYKVADATGVIDKIAGKKPAAKPTQKKDEMKAETDDDDDYRMITREVRLRIDEEGTQFTPTWSVEKKIPVLYDDEDVLAGVVEDMAENAEKYANDHNDNYRFSAETFEAPIMPFNRSGRPCPSCRSWSQSFIGGVCSRCASKDRKKAEDEYDDDERFEADTPDPINSEYIEEAVQNLPKEQYLEFCDYFEIDPNDEKELSQFLQKNRNDSNVLMKLDVLNLDAWYDSRYGSYGSLFRAETFEAKENCECKNYTPDFNHEKPMTTDDEYEQAVIVPITCDDCGKKGETVYLHGYNEYDDSNLQWFDAETFEAKSKGKSKCSKCYWDLAVRRNPISGERQFFNQCLLCGKKDFSRGGSAMSDTGFFAEDMPFGVHVKNHKTTSTVFYRRKPFRRFRGNRHKEKAESYAQFMEKKLKSNPNRFSYFAEENPRCYCLSTQADLPHDEWEELSDGVVMQGPFTSDEGRTYWYCSYCGSKDNESLGAETFEAPYGRMPAWRMGKGQWNKNHLVWASDSKAVREAIKTAFPEQKFSVRIVNGQYIEVVAKSGTRPADIQQFKEDIKSVAMKALGEIYKDSPEELREKYVDVQAYERDFGAEEFGAESYETIKSRLDRIPNYQKAWRREGYSLAPKYCSRHDWRVHPNQGYEMTKVNEGVAVHWLCSQCGIEGISLAEKPNERRE